MKWLIELLMRSNRLKGLSESQLKDLIDTAKDPESLKLIKEHLERGSFKYVHIEKLAPDLIERCVNRAKEMYYALPEVKEKFMEEIIERIDWL